MVDDKETARLLLIGFLCGIALVVTLVTIYFERPSMKAKQTCIRNVNTPFEAEGPPE